MKKVGYRVLAILNLILGAGAIFVYAPIMLSAFNVNVSKWNKVVVNLFDKNYSNVLICFGLAILVYIFILNIATFFYKLNVPKFCFKLGALVALVLPLIYVSGLKFDFMLEFWIKNIAKNIKTLSYISIVISGGLFLLGFIFNFISGPKANIVHILQNLAMALILLALIYINNWCGWEYVKALPYIKIYGALMGVLGIYLPLSSISLLICAKLRD